MSDDSPKQTRGSVDLLYLDQGALLNLLLLGHVHDIVQALPYQCAITKGIYDAAYSFWDNTTLSELLPDGPQRTLEALLSHHTSLEVHPHEKHTSLSTYFKLASRVPEPRASLLTLTVTTHATLLSDDRYTRAILKALFPDTPVISTLTLLYFWQERRSLLNSDLRTAMQHLRDRVYFFPSENDPLFPWWEHILAT